MRPNPRSPAPRHVYEAKAARWTSVWPELTVLPWQDDASGALTAATLFPLSAGADAGTAGS